MADLFPDAPKFPPRLPDEELAFLAALPDWPTTMQVLDDDERVARRLERKGLIKVSREKMDDIASRPTWFAGKLAAAGIREVQ